MIANGYHGGKTDESIWYTGESYMADNSKSNKPTSCPVFPGSSWQGKSLAWMLWLSRFHSWAVHFLFVAMWQESRFENQEKTKTLLLIDFCKDTHLVYTRTLAIFKTNVLHGSVKHLNTVINYHSLSIPNPISCCAILMCDLADSITFY